MVFTIHRYIFRDLLVSFVSGTVVLSSVLGLGGLLRPLRQFGVDASRVPELLLCMFPITLTVTMPIAALLAATLTYGRLAADRELDACRASGIGLVTLVYPALTLALLVGLATLLLGFHVIPSYTERLEGVVQRDAEAILYRNIKKDGRLHGLLPDVILHADAVYPEEHRLTGVAAVRYNRTGFEEIVTARQVDVQIDTHVEPHQVRLRFWNARVIDRDGNSSRAERLTVTRDFAGFWRDHIKFKKLSDLQAIRADMTRFRPVVKRLDEFRAQYLVELFRDACERSLRDQGYVVLPQGQWQQEGDEMVLVGAGRLQVYAQDCRLHARDVVELTLAPESRLRVDSYRESAGGYPERRYWADRGRLAVNATAATPLAALDLTNVEWYFVAAQDRPPSYPGQTRLAPLLLNPELLTTARGVTLEAVLADDLPRPKMVRSEYLDRLQQKLRNEVAQLETDIEVELHSRLAFGVSCVVLVVFGAALGIAFRSAHLLMAFGVSVLPAALCLITILTGKHMAESSDVSLASGEMFLWSGIVAVALANAMIYWRLTRN